MPTALSCTVACIPTRENVQDNKSKLSREHHQFLTLAAATLPADVHKILMIGNQFPHAHRCVAMAAWDEVYI